MSATKAMKLPGNVRGKYYTTEDCDGCAYCASVAPDHFDYDSKSNTYYVCRQPRVPGEEAVVIDAKEDCPVDAICMAEEGEEEGGENRQ
jgi:ferredoxin